ncbi:hypothetical protein JQU17_18465 [Ponticoccus sp. SC2-23]|nr:hypothetical protein [Ponticoccus sp. SC6-9]MBM1224472.1 hypothetical protein [Ponticoccus sp. SC6-15]MBM1229748.1 hypothetical protein [Ponticoccus sp. SC6-38]MBM1233438.1 hypothetical protein [Ponticoccus sp. SC6-45]MBM1236612.1 hypothetical protein [Ponticoccus sp. SC6-49]MBM1244656.1 hypothetical protein [Ponticoccus sp. SC2-64]MBM1246962.1 hypothetical protein [Ponticoccus sp. SC6-42]MBM1251440.1 hypothetical protein [Ponticoccus sp. SC6-33]MBM1254621.1 hypothetical protein [Pontico
MDCLERDAPINVMVQLLFVARNSPGLRRLGRCVRFHHCGAGLEVLPNGGAFTLPGIGTLRVSYDVIADTARLEVLTLSLSDCPDSTIGRDEADRLDAQSRILQPLIAELEADETHWHLLPGPVDRAGERRLARRAIDLLRRPVWSARPRDRFAAQDVAEGDFFVKLAGKTSPSGHRPHRVASEAIVAPPANDLPALPRLRRDRLATVLDALADRAGPVQRHRLTLQIGTGCAVVMSQSAGA